MPELTQADLADHVVSFTMDLPPRTIRCAYITGDDKLPRTLVFKDHDHRTVALVNHDAVLTVEREHPPAGFANITYPISAAAGLPMTQTWTGYVSQPNT